MASFPQSVGNLVPEVKHFLLKQEIIDNRMTFASAGPYANYMHYASYCR